MTREPVCVVVGVGPGLGAAYARRVTQTGYAVALVARGDKLTASLAAELGERAHAYQCDVASEAEVSSTFASIHAELGAVDVLVYNAGSGVWGTIEAVGADAFEQAWRINALGLFLASRAVMPSMSRLAPSQRSGSPALGPRAAAATPSNSGLLLAPQLASHPTGWLRIW